MYLAGINDMEIISLFTELKQYDVDCFNLLNQVPSGNKQQKLTDSSYCAYKRMRAMLMEQGFPLTTQCRQCRSDFCGY